MKHTFKKIIVLTVLGMVMIVPVFVRAQGVTPPSGSAGVTPPTPSTYSTTPLISNPLNCGSQCDLTSFITLVLNNVIMPLAAMVAVVFIIWAGFNFVIAQGNATKLKEAKSQLLWALIGTGVLLGAAGISQVIQTTVKSLTN